MIRITFLIILVGVLFIIFVRMLGDPFYAGVDLSGLLAGTFNYEVDQAPEDLPISREPAKTIDISQILVLRKLFQQEKWIELNQALDAIESRFSVHPLEEYPVYDSYKTFHVTLPDYEPLFQHWINHSEKEYQPYLAAAQYYYARGWESRGGKWAKSTSDDQFQNMAAHFSKAAEYAIHALEINPDLFMGYHTLIGIYNTTGENRLENLTIATALERFPFSFLLRSAAVWAKGPRWGGSYRQIEDIADDAQKYAKMNPGLSRLYGFIYYDQARILRRNKKYEDAALLLERAIAFGDHWGFYNALSELYFYDLKNHNLALDYINTSIELRPTISENYRMRSKIFMASDDWRDVLSDMKTARAISPGDPDNEQLRQKAATYLLNQGHRLYKEDLSSAIEKYALAQRFDAGNIDAFYWKGMALHLSGNSQAALSELKTAIGLDPGHFNSFKAIAYILSKTGQWDTMVGYWNKFLDVSPAHADGYFERAHAYYSLKNIEYCLRDLKKSCSLGHQKACKRYQKMTDQTE